MSGWMPIERSSLTECWVGLVFSSPADGMYGSSVRWMKTAWPRGSSLPSWRIASKNGRPSMSPTVPPISHEHEVEALVAVADEILDRVGDVRDHLDGGAEIVAAPLLGDDVLVDAAGGDVVLARSPDAGEALVMAEVEVGLGAVVGDEDLAVLVRAHRPRIDVEIGVELAQADRDSRAPAAARRAPRRRGPCQGKRPRRR